MPHILVSAAEPSGDQHAGHLVQAAREQRPDVEWTAFGGPCLARAVSELHEDLTGSASMVLGFAGEIGQHLRRLASFDRLLETRRPDAILLVDSPGLHFLFARLARWRGVPVLYYICPQIWAWGPWRRRKVLRYTDLLLPILPFEEELYGGGRVPVRYVGHPLGDELASYGPDAGAILRRELGVAPDETLVGIFPGSRKQEVETLAEVLSRLVRRAGEGVAALRPVVSCYRDGFRPLIERGAEAAGIDVRIWSGDARLLMAASDVAVVASGTAALELAWFGTPMVVLYRTNAIGSRFFSAFRVTPWIALPNILGAATNGGEPLVYEKLFVGDPVDEVAPVLAELLGSRSAREEAARKLRALRDGVLRPGGVETAARAVLEFLASLEGRKPSSPSEDMHARADARSVRGKPGELFK